MALPLWFKSFKAFIRVTGVMVFLSIVLLWTKQQIFGKGSASVHHELLNRHWHPGKPSLLGHDPSAYVFYAKEETHACSVLVNVDRLQNIFKTAHPIYVLATNTLSQSYLDAFEAKNVTVVIEKQALLPRPDTRHYRGCLLKLLAFRMHHVDPSLMRLIVISPDMLVLQDLDHLFSLPHVDLAAPRAYWMGGTIPCAQLLVINLSDRLWSTIVSYLQKATENIHEVDLVNQIIGDTGLILPGQYVTLNWHWGVWSMPNWYHSMTPEIDNGYRTTLVKDAFNIVTRLSKSSLRRLFRPALVSQKFPHNVRDLARLSTSETRQTKGTPGARQLEHVYQSTVVLYFHTMRKPWAWSSEAARLDKQGAHPLFYKQFKIWRDAAVLHCPKWIQ